MPLTPPQLQSLTALVEQTNADAAWTQRRADLNRRRELVVREMQDLLKRFLTNQLALRELKETFDQKTRNEWNVFGLKGTSGAMFLNMLVNNTRDSEAVARELKAALPLPTAPEAESRMRQCFRFLENLSQSDGITGAGVRPNRVPFFLSAWWHIQDQEPWPIYYVTARQTLTSLGLFAESQDPVADYMQFRQLWLECSRLLALKSWLLESVLAHACEHESQPASPVGDPSAPPPREAGNEPPEPPVEEIRSHTEVQWMLATLGRQLGCRVWIASNDHGAAFNGTPLGSLSISELPNLGMGDQPQRVVRLIDVIWLRGHRIVAAFEVESTTSVYSGLLRMADLNALCPNLSFPCYISIPAQRREKVRRELSRPAFSSLGLPERCGYITFEDLRRDHDALMRLATTPETIRRLATFVQDSEQSAE
jgi:hypothetical protein